MELYYTGYHAIGGTGLNVSAGITGAGGIVLIKDCRVGHVKDPNGDGSSVLTCYQTNGGEVFIVDGLDIIGCVPTAATGLGNTSPIIAHNNTGNMGLIWEKGVNVKPHPQACRVWFPYGYIPPTGGDPAQCRCFVVGRKLGTSQYPVAVTSDYQSHGIPDQWHANAVLNVYTATGQMGITGGWLVNPSIQLIAESGAGQIMTQAGNQFGQLINGLFILDFVAATIGSYISVGNYGGDGGSSLLSVLDSIIWGACFSNSTPANMVYAGTQAGNTVRGIYTGYPSTNGATFMTQLDGVDAINNSLPLGQFPSLTSYLPGLASNLVSSLVTAPQVEYDSKWNNRTEQALRYVGPLVPSNDGPLKLQAWEDATELLDAQGWGSPDPQAAKIATSAADSPNAIAAQNVLITNAIDGPYTFTQTLRAIAAATAGTEVGVDASHIGYKALGGSTVRVTANISGSYRIVTALDLD